ncbi:MAG: hypothetical protein IOD15_00850 [Phycisphaerales bacterium]|nr:hypothetical protein [Phycisphaerales bacterium]
MIGTGDQPAADTAEVAPGESGATSAAHAPPPGAPRRPWFGLPAGGYQPTLFEVGRPPKRSKGLLARVVLPPSNALAPRRADESERDYRLRIKSRSAEEATGCLFVDGVDPHDGGPA